MNWLKNNKKKIIRISLYSLVALIVLPIIVIGLILTIQGLKKDKLPSIFNIVPLIVVTESMEPKINGGDLIFTKIVNSEEINEKEIISFWDPTNSSKVVTHEVIDKYEKEGKIYFKTKGINNNSPDKIDVSEDLLIGRYVGKLPFVGKITMFIQSTEGLIICLLIPLVIILSIDYFYRVKKEEEKDQEIEKLKAEIESLKNK